MAKKKAPKVKKQPAKTKKKVPKFVKIALTPSVTKLAATLTGGAAGPSQTQVDVQGNMTSGDLYIVKIDGIKVPMTNDHGSMPVSAGSHWLTTDLVGDVGSTVTVTATANGKQVAACSCTVTDDSNPRRHADCADDFTT